MCKQIKHIYFCEELFLVKHKTKHSCESALFYNLESAFVKQNCQFKYFYNTTVIPSVLDGGSEIVLANMLNEKRLICTYDQGLATSTCLSLCFGGQKALMSLSYSIRVNLCIENYWQLQFN